MRELHVVAVSEDGRHVLLGTTRSAKAGTFRVRLDDRLVAAVRGDLRLAEAPAVELSPKEIQARLRAGESAESIARKAGVAITRVERFAGPVAGEMARTIDAARDAHLVRRSGRSTVPMGTAVDAVIGDAEASWTTRREDDGRWRVSVAWNGRGRSRSGAWWYDPHSSALSAVDPASAALAHVGEDQPKRRAPRAAAPEPAAAPSPKAPARRAKPASKAAAAPPKQSGAKKATGTQRTKQAPSAAPKAARKTAPKAAPPAAKATAARTPARRGAPAKTARPRLQVVPDPPAKPRKARTTAEERDGVSSRATVPAWADVLLGTTPGDR